MAEAQATPAEQEALVLKMEAAIERSGGTRLVRDDIECVVRSRACRPPSPVVPSRALIRNNPPTVPPGAFRRGGLGQDEESAQVTDEMLARVLRVSLVELDLR